MRALKYGSNQTSDNSATIFTFCEIISFVHNLKALHVYIMHVYTCLYIKNNLKVNMSLTRGAVLNFS